MQQKVFAKEKSRAGSVANMAKTKALAAATNVRLRGVVREIVRREFSTQKSAAAAFGVSGSFLTDFLAGKKGAGPALLFGIAPYDPLELLRALDLDPKTVLALWRNSDEGEELPHLPDALTRASRAAIELLHCPAEEVAQHALAALDELGEGGDDRDPTWWLERLKERLPKRSASGVRRKRRPSGTYG